MYLVNQFLFPFFPRELGVKSPKTGKLELRKRIYTWDQVRRVIEVYNGYKHIYISVYPLRNVLNKVVFDIDSYNLENSLHTAIQIYEMAKKENLYSVPVFSGKKGFHVYVLFQKTYFRNRSMMDMAIKYIYNYFVNSVDPVYKVNVDTHLRNSHALIRLPNTLHPETLKYASPLPNYFPEMSIKEILEWSSNPHDLWELHLEGKFRDPRQYIILEQENEKEEVVVPEFGKINLEVSDVDRYLLGLVRPCIVYYAHQPEADHFIRTALSTELSWLDIPPEEQVKIFKKLRWSDFNERVSYYHANRIFQKVKNKELFPPSCKKLQDLQYCLGRTCPYYPRGVFYWWGVY